MTSIPATVFRAVLFLIAFAFIALDQPADAQAPSWLRHVLTDSTGALVSGDLSPDEKWIVYTRDLSQQESEVLVRSTDGGAPRPLFELKGLYRFILFSPSGDRVIFSSSLPQRDAADASLYLMAAPFNTRTGTLSGPPRQISFDPIIQIPRFRPAVSPDGSQVAYVDGNTTALKVVPITGGNARTLVTPSQRLVPLAPSHLSWTDDGKAVRYEFADDRGERTSYRVGATGGTPTRDGAAGHPLPGKRVFARYTRSSRGNAAAIRFVDDQGKQVGNDLVLPSSLGSGLFLPSPDRKYVVFAAIAGTADIRIVSTAGGPIGNTTISTGYDWPVAWTADSRLAISLGDYRGTPTYHGASTDGRVTMRHTIPQGSGNGIAVIGSTIIERPRGTQSSYQAVSIPDGSRRVLVEGAYDDAGCCRAPGGAYTASGDEFYFVRRVNGRIEVRGATLTGRNRLVAELPASTLGEDKAVFGDRVAYSETVGDSIRLQVKSGRSAPIRLATFPRSSAPQELVWSRDGKRLAVIGGTPGISLYQFDESGKPAGDPTRITVPFTYQYELMWLPDGSGLTMVAQPRDTPVSQIALVRLSDPTHPLILTREDPNNKWGHTLSPDGKLIAYSTEKGGQSALWLIDLARAFEEARRR